VNNIYVFEKRGIDYYQIGILSNQGANPQAPYYDDLFIQELDTGADTFQFSTVSNSYVQGLLVIGNYVGFYYNNRYEIFAITGLEYSHYEGYKTIGVYAEGIGFELLEVFMERPPITEYPGRDNDDDGDDQYDDEYADPDDIYIDENGNIIYDKDGSGPPSADDVTIDEDGNIIYKPNKRNKNNDSLEFKNISYPTFLNVLLKDTDWEIVCQPGLESVKHDISVRYDTNIYAILQDSMQAYRGVELEFVHEAKAQHSVGNFPVQKIIKAYKDGGRGSFVGKRFEYGTNVRGITKTQEVAHNKEDSVIYVDNVGVDVYYDIDFALKSAEVPEIEIGDTHYVIDNEFRPPMTIKARIGRIEISFSDPTKNKITVANNKKIMGSVVDDDDINDTVKNLDDTISDTITDDYIYDIVDDAISEGIDVDLSEYATITYVDDAIAALDLDGGGNDGDINLGIDMPDGALRYEYDSIDDELYGKFVFHRNVWFDEGYELRGDYITSNSMQTINMRLEHVALISIGADGSQSNYVEFVNDIRMPDYTITCKKLTQSSDKSLKENIRYIDDTVITTSDDLLDKADLHDFIVNQVNLCEYNFIGDTSDNIGFIANDYEGTKVGDKIVSRNGENDTLTYDPNNLLFATIGALQEEVRMRDEQIASLEARLAKIEEMLNNK
jgi:hypothetical protein